MQHEVSGLLFSNFPSKVSGFCFQHFGLAGIDQEADLFGSLFH